MSSKEKCYVITKDGFYYNGRTGIFLKKKHLASIFTERKNADSINTKMKLNGTIEKFLLSEFTDLYQEIAFDLAINLQYMQEVFDHFQGNFKAFSQVDSDIIELTKKGIDLLKKGNRPTFEMYEGISSEFKDGINDVVSFKLRVVEEVALLKNGHLEEAYNYLKDLNSKLVYQEGVKYKLIMSDNSEHIVTWYDGYFRASNKFNKWKDNSKKFKVELYEK